MNQYLMILVIAALAVVAFINADSNNRAKFGKIETELLIRGPTTKDAVMAMDETEEITFKCRKEIIPTREDEESLQTVPRKANEKR